LLRHPLDHHTSPAADPALPWALSRTMPAGIPATATTPAPTPVPAPRGASSRRRRLWELEGHAHCPVVGVCLPLPALRRLYEKSERESAPADDYDFHCVAVARCKQRSPLAEAVNKALDRRFALDIQRAARCKTAEELQAWWDDVRDGRAMPGAFWATLTHPHCTVPLAGLVLGQVHMLQHQVGMVSRVEVERFESLIDENAVLSRQLASAQERSTIAAREAAARIEELQRTVVQLRGQLLAADTAREDLRMRLQELESTRPDLPQRTELQRKVLELREQLLYMRRTRQRDDLARPAGAAESAPAPLPKAIAAAAAPSIPAATVPLQERSVLCVGGRTASVPAYRALIERAGARFLHHDGGEEDSTSRLDATLAAADLVICQTGCISHGAYWRVKDHCRRTGKRCVFVETPSRHSLARALGIVAAPATIATEPERSVR